MHRQNIMRLAGGMFALGLILFAQAAVAATYTWDATTGNAQPDDGGGTWSNTDANWWTSSSTNVAWVTSTDSAVFGAGAGSSPYTIALGSNVTAAGITFAGQNYTVNRDAGNLFGLTIGSGGVTSNATSTINAPITLGAGQTWTSTAGTLTLGGSINGGSYAVTTTGGSTIALTGTSSLAGLLTVGAGVFSINGGSVSLANAQCVTGAPAGGVAQLNLVNGASLTLLGSTYNFRPGWTNAATGTTIVTVADTSSLILHEQGEFIVGDAGTAIINQTGGLLKSDGSAWDGMNLRNSATYNQTGGTLSLRVNAYDGMNISTAGATWNFSGGFAQFNKLQGAGKFNFGGGTLQLNGAPTNSQTWTIALTGSGGNGTIDTNGYNLSLANAITGTGGLTKAGSGNLTLAGNSSYSGGTVVMAGVLALGHSAGLGSTSGTLAISGGSVDIAGFSPTIGKLTLGGGYLVNSGTSSATATIGSGGITSNATSTVSAAITLGAGQTWTTNAGTLSVGKVSGAQNLTLSGTGTGTINTMGGTGAAPSYLSITGGGTWNVLSGSLASGTGGAAALNMYTAAGGTTTLNYSAGTTTIGGSSWIQVGSPGSGTNILNINGGNIISAGQYTANLGQVAGTSFINVTAGSFTESVNGEAFLGNAGGVGTMTISGSGLVVFNYPAQQWRIGRAGGSGTLNLLTGGTLATGRQIGYTGGGGGTIYFKGGVLQAIGAGRSDWITGLPHAYVGAGGAIIDTNGFDMGIPQNLEHDAALGATPDGGLTKNGSGTLTLSGSSYFTGGLTVNAGTVQVGLQNALQSATGTTTINPGGTLSTSNNITSHIKAVTLSGGTLASGTPDATWGSWSLDGDVRATGGVTSTITAANIWMDQSGGNNFNVDAGATLNMAGNFATPSGQTASALVKSGPGTMVISSANSYASATTVNNGTLQVTGSGAINSTSGITVSGSGAMFLHTGNTAVSPTLTLSQGTLLGTGTVNTVNVADSTAAVVQSGYLGTGVLTVNNLTFSGSGQINVANVTGGAPSYLTVGTLAANGGTGTVAINIGGANTWTPNTSYKLIGYTTLSGSGTFAALAKGSISPSLGNRLNGTLVNNTGSNEIDFSVTGDSPKWTGANNTSWSTAAQLPNQNWQLIGSGAPTDYLQSDQVLFDDSAGTATTVNIDAANVNPSSVRLSTTATYTLGGAYGIAGATGLTKDGSGTLVINNTNAYTGATTINGGKIVISADAALGAVPASPTPGNIVLNGGELAANASFVLSSSRGIALGPNPGAGSGTLDVAAGANMTYGGILANNGAGTGSLVKTGSGTLLLTGSSNSYSGGTTIQDGTIALGINNALPVTGTLTLGAAGGGGTLDLAGFNQQVAGLAVGSGAAASAQIVGNSSTANNSTLTFNSAGSSTFAGTIQDTLGSGNQKVDLTLAAGRLTLSGSNTFSGATTVSSGGTLQLGGPTALYSGASAGNISLAGALDLGGYAVALPSIGGAGTVTNSIGGGTLSLGRGDATSTFAGTVSDGAGTIALVKTGSGTLVLSGTNAYTGGTTVNAGVLQAVNAAGFGTGGGTVSVLPGAALDINGQALNGTAANNYVVSVSGSGASGTGAIVNSGTSQVNALRILSLAGDTVLGGTGRWDLRQASSTAGVTLTGNGFNLTKTGTNYLAIVGQGGGTTPDTGGALVTGVQNININQGTLAFSCNTTVDNITPGSIFVNSGGTLAVANFGSTPGLLVTKPIVMAGGVLRTDNSTTAGNATIAANIVLNATGTFGPQTGSTLTLSGNISDGTAGAQRLVVADVGAVVLGGTNSYSGGTTINGGTLGVSSDSNLGAVPAAVTPGSIVLNNGYLSATSNMVLSSSRGITLGPATGSGWGEIDVSSGASMTYGGTMVGNGAGVQSLWNGGAGELVLTGSSNLSGCPNVTAGTLTISGGSLVANSGESRIYAAAGSTAQLNLVNGGNLTFAGGVYNFRPGYGNNATGTAIVTVADTSSLLLHQGGAIILGDTGTGILNQTGGLILFDGNQWSGIDVSNGGTAIYNQSGGTLALNETGGNDQGMNLRAATGTWNFTGGLAQLHLLQGPGTFNFGGGTLQANGSFNVMSLGTMNLTGSGGTSTIDTAGYAVGFANAIGGTGGLWKMGSGTLTLLANNGYAGGATVAGGVLRLGHNAALGTGGLTANGGTVDLAGYSPTVLGLSGSAGILTNSGTGNCTLTVNQTSAATFSGMIQDGANSIALIKTGSAMLTLAGPSSYSGATTVNAGTLRFTSIADENAGPSALGNPAVGQGTINLGTAPSTMGTLEFTGGTADAHSSNRVINLLTDGVLRASGTGGAVLALTNTAAAVTAAEGGELTLGGDSDGSITAINLAGDASLRKTGLGTWTLTKADSYSGGTTVDAGTLVVGDAGALPAGKDLAIASGGHVVLASGLAHAISLGGLTITSGAGVVSASPLVPNPGQAGSLTYGAASPTPEPGTLALLAAALAFCGAAVRRSRRAIVARGSV